MADIVIRGMSMPLLKTELIVFPSGVVQVYDSRENYLGKAQAVPLPEKHGRLMAEWISVKDRLPEEWQKVIVFWWEHDEPMIDTAFWQPDGKRFDGQHWVRMEEKITHWMPLPEPPKEVQDGN